jgi:hypothetical protein
MDASQPESDRMPRDLTLAGTPARSLSGTRTRSARAIPAGYGLALGAAISVALWVGLAKLAMTLFG